MWEDRHCWDSCLWSLPAWSGVSKPRSLSLEHFLEPLAVQPAIPRVELASFAPWYEMRTSCWDRPRRLSATTVLSCKHPPPRHTHRHILCLLGICRPQLCYKSWFLCLGSKPPGILLFAYWSMCIPTDGHNYMDSFKEDKKERQEVGRVWPSVSVTLSQAIPGLRIIQFSK